MSLLETMYFKELEQYSEISDYLHDNYYCIVDKLITEYNNKNKILNDTEMEVWYIDYLEPLANEVWNEMESYLSELNYTTKGFDILDSLSEILC